MTLLKHNGKWRRQTRRKKNSIMSVQITWVGFFFLFLFLLNVTICSNQIQKQIKIDTSKVAFEAEIDRLRQMIPGAGFDLRTLTDANAKSLFGKIGEENSVLKSEVGFIFIF